MSPSESTTTSTELVHVPATTPAPYPRRFLPKGSIFAFVLLVLYRFGAKDYSCELANEWADTVVAHKPRPRRYAASYIFQDKQKLHPLCDYCTWMVLPGQPHDYCESVMREASDETDAVMWFIAEIDLDPMAAWDRLHDLSSENGQFDRVVNQLIIAGVLYGGPDHCGVLATSPVTHVDTSEFDDHFGHDDPDEPFDVGDYHDDHGYGSPDDDEIDDESRAEIEHGKRHEMY